MFFVVMAGLIAFVFVVSGYSLYQKRKKGE